jgi:hypothetical protein
VGELETECEASSESETESDLYASGSKGWLRSLRGGDGGAVDGFIVLVVLQFV